MKHNFAILFDYFFQERVLGFKQSAFCDNYRKSQIRLEKSASLKIKIDMIGQTYKLTPKIGRKMLRCHQYKYSATNILKLSPS